MHSKVLMTIILATAIFASYNTYEEQLTEFWSFSISVFSGLLGSLIALSVYVSVNKWSAQNMHPFRLVAYISGIFALLAYINYALNGKADSLNSAGHMHVIMFPILHVFITFIGLTFASIWVLFKKFLKRGR